MHDGCLHQIEREKELQEPVVEGRTSARTNARTSATNDKVAHRTHSKVELCDKRKPHIARPNWPGPVGSAGPMGQPIGLGQMGINFKISPDCSPPCCCEVAMGVGFGELCYWMGRNVEEWVAAICKGVPELILSAGVGPSPVGPAQ